MAKSVIGIIMNGVTGRMGANQHLARSIVPIREQGGIDAGDGEKLYPEPFLIGRSQSKLEALAAEFGISRFSTSLDEALADPEYSIYFDAQTTAAREASVRRAILAGKRRSTAPSLSPGSPANARSKRASFRTNCSCPASASSRAW
jgi:predicted dehydrogenase